MSCLLLLKYLYHFSRTWIPGWLHGKEGLCWLVWTPPRNCGFTRENGSALVSACYESELLLSGENGQKVTTEDQKQASWYKRLLKNIYFLIYWLRCLSFMENKWILTFMWTTEHLWINMNFSVVNSPAPFSGSQELPDDVICCCWVALVCTPWFKLTSVSSDNLTQPQRVGVWLGYLRTVRPCHLPHVLRQAHIVLTLCS